MLKWLDNNLDKLLIDTELKAELERAADAENSKKVLGASPVLSMSFIAGPCGQVVIIKAKKTSPMEDRLFDVTPAMVVCPISHV